MLFKIQMSQFIHFCPMNATVKHEFVNFQTISELFK